MEHVLKKLRLPPPPPGLREKVLAAARAELEQAAAGKPDWVDRLWKSRKLWYSAAATVLLCLVAIFSAPDGMPSPNQSSVAPPAPSPATVATAKELAASLGDGPALEQRLTSMLTGPAAMEHEPLTRAELWRTIQ